MEYFPSNFEMEQHKIVAKKKTALLRLKKLGLTMPYISAVYTYEQLFLEQVIIDLNYNEIDYLKEGFTSLVECLKVVSETPTITKEKAYENAYEKHKEYADKFLNTKNHEDVVKWLNEKADFEVQYDPKSKATTEEVLVREIAEFKIRLGRVNVVVDIKDGALKFNDKKKMEKLTIYSKEIKENPYPDIFKDYDSFVLFEHLHSIFKNTNTQGADYGFIYWKMLKDGFVLSTYKPEKFRKWIGGEIYNITTGSPFKTINWCSTQLKEDLYETLKTIR